MVVSPVLSACGSVTVRGFYLLGCPHECAIKCRNWKVGFGALFTVGNAPNPEFQATAQEFWKRMFIGEYIHSVDDKKRLSVPSRFRKELGKRAVITLGLNKCLSLYTTKEWGAFAEKLSRLSMGKSEDRGFSRAMLSGAFEVEIDSIGRILIPDALKMYAGIKERVVLTGVFNRVEIWDENTWQTYKSQVVAETDRMAEQLGERGVF